MMELLGIKTGLRLRTSNPIERALAYAGGSHTLADIEAAVATGQMQAWNGDESAIITEIRRTPQQLILLFFLAGGQMTELRAMAPPIMDWGRSLGCVKAQLLGRKGWARSPIVTDGWKEAGTLMEVSLG